MFSFYVIEDKDKSYLSVTKSIANLSLVLTTLPTLILDLIFTEVIFWITELSM